jgi:hypothetical protein
VHFRVGSNAKKHWSSFREQKPFLPAFATRLRQVLIVVSARDFQLSQVSPQKSNIVVERFNDKKGCI